MPHNSSTPDQEPTEDPNEAIRRWLGFAHRVWFGGSTHGTEAPPGEPPLAELRRCGLSGWVGQVLQRCGDSRASLFKRDMMRISLRNVVAMAALSDILVRMRAEGLVAMPIKGSAFLLREGSQAYAIRPMSDLDIYVEPSQYGRVMGLLAAMGFQARHPPTDRCSAAVVNEVTWTKVLAGVPVIIDLHRRFGAWPTLPGLQPLLSSERQQIDGVEVPSPMLAALLGLAHRARSHDRTDARELLDIYRAWCGMTRDAAERYMIKVQQLGLWQEHRRLVEEMREVFVLQSLPMVGRTGDEGQALAVPQEIGFRQRLSARYGQGTAIEQMAAATVYHSARLIDRVLFRRGAERWARRSPAGDGRGYWEHAP